MGKNDDGLFPQPPRSCQHKNTYTNEHQKLCSDCGQVVGNAPH